MDDSTKPAPVRLYAVQRVSDGKYYSTTAHNYHVWVGDLLECLMCDDEVDEFRNDPRKERDGFDVVAFDLVPVEADDGAD